MGLKFCICTETCVLLTYISIDSTWIFCVPHKANSVIRFYPSLQNCNSNRMTHSCLSYDWVLLIFFHGILLMCMSSCLKSVTIPAFANETDRLALLDFKNRMTKDPLQIMSSWNDSIHFCNWIGVTCSPSSKRVMVLNLTAKKLSGSIPPSIGNLTYLTGINLKNNRFNGEIPQEVGRLQRLQHLNLSSNSFGGKLPTNLSYCVLGHMWIMLGTYVNIELANPLKKCNLLVIG